MSAEYSVEEVRAAINGFVGYSHTHHGVGGDLIGIAQAYAKCIEADERAVPDGYTALLSDGKRYWADKPGEHGDWKPYFLGHPPAQAAQVDRSDALERAEEDVEAACIASLTQYDDGTTEWDEYTDKEKGYVMNRMRRALEHFARRTP